jgi:hypothetical protein
MYSPTGVGLGTAGVASLPFTGLPLVFAILAAFAVLALGLALWRMAPRSEA